MVNHAPRGLKPKLLAPLLVFFGIFLMSAGWALSMPLGAGTDEPQHIIKAASVVRGEFIGEATGEPAVTLVTVPASLSLAGYWPCYAQDPTVGGECSEIHQHEGLAQATTSAGMYYPGFYLLTGWPSLVTENPTFAVWGMRLISGLVTALFLTGVFVVLSRFMSRIVSLTAIALITVPQSLFLSAIVNPNSWEISGGMAFLAGLLWYSRTPNFRGGGQKLAFCLIAFGGLLAASARGVSPFWLFLFGVIFLVATPKQRILELLRAPVFLIALAISMVGAALSAVWTLVTGTLSRMGDFAGSDMSPFMAFTKTLLANLSDPGLIGYFGWLDTPAPYPVYFIYGGAVIGVLALAFVVANRRWQMVLVSAAIVYLCAPALLQASAIKNSGYIWQGRYTIVALSALLLIAIFAIAFSGRGWVFATRAGSRTTRRFLCVMLGLFALAQILAFLQDLKRYAAPGSGTSLHALIAPQWEPAYVGTIGATTVFLLGVAAVACVAVLIQRTERKLSVQRLFEPAINR